MNRLNFNLAIVILASIISLSLTCADKQVDSITEKIKKRAAIREQEIADEYELNMRAKANMGKAIGKPKADLVIARNAQAPAKRIYALPARSASLPVGIGNTVGKVKCIGGRQCPCANCQAHYETAREGYVRPLDKLAAQTQQYLDALKKQIDQ